MKRLIQLSIATLFAANLCQAQVTYFYGETDLKIEWAAAKILLLAMGAEGEPGEGGIFLTPIGMQHTWIDGRYLTSSNGTGWEDHLWNTNVAPPDEESWESFSFTWGQQSPGNPVYLPYGMSYIPELTFDSLTVSTTPIVGAYTVDAYESVTYYEFDPETNTIGDYLGSATRTAHKEKNHFLHHQFVGSGGYGTGQ